ncbi:MAG: hypothetical protein M0025_10495 [Elusimicrobia bacterium]|nr:hypothetical protein [Elusimicrobiota bacterium]
MRTVPLIPFLLCCCACAIPQPGMYGASPYAKKPVSSFFGQQQEAAPYVDETVDVVSYPPGARIQVNDAFAGYAPVRYSVRRLWRGQPGMMTLDTVKIEALPVAAGQCVQGGFYGQGNQKVPSPVSFTMTSCAPAQQSPEGYRNSSK